MLEKIAEDVKAAINAEIENTQEDPRRDHLGASIIGRECMREIWYSWRWADPVLHDARMLRLFNRGHREEDRFIEWLTPICKDVWPLDPRTGEQIRVNDFKGYFGGSLDGVVRNPAGYEGDYLVEFKTHGDKSYQKLVVQGVRESKPEHYTQMQVYLHYKQNLRGALYFAINKNDDSLYVEFVPRDPDHVKVVFKKIANILLSQQPPERMEGASEYNFKCNKICDFPGVCWRNKQPAKSCRTCAFVKTTDDGWYCDKWNTMLDSKAQRDGCENYERLF